MRTKLSICGIAALTIFGGATLLAEPPVLATHFDCTPEQSMQVISAVNAECERMGYDGGYASNIECNEYGASGDGTCWNA